MSNPAQKAVIESPPNRSFREIFAEEESALLRFAFGLLGRREVAEDVVQDSFLALHREFAGVQNPRAWLYRAVRNKALNELRKRSRETLDDEMDAGADEKLEAASETLAKLEAAGQLQLLVSELKAQDGELLQLKYFEGLGYKEIAQRTQLSVSNVGYRLHHILKGLGDGLRKLGIDGATK